MSTRSPGPELVGRDTELARLAGVVREAGPGRGAVLAIRGDRGTGKTSLLERVARSAGDRYVVRLAGVADESGLCGAGADRLARALGGRVPEAARPSDLGPVLQDLALAHRTPGLLCLVDDAHLLDGATLVALGHLADRFEESGLVLVVAGAPGRYDGVLGVPATVHLGPLTPGHAVDLLQRLAPELDAVVAELLARGVDATPGAVTELAGRVRRHGPLSAIAAATSTGGSPLVDAARLACDRPQTADRRARIELAVRAAELAKGLGAVRLAIGVLDSLDPTEMSADGHLRVLLLRSGTGEATGGPSPDALLEAVSVATDPAADVVRRVLLRVLTLGLTGAGDADLVARAAGRAARTRRHWDDRSTSALVLAAVTELSSRPSAGAVATAREAVRRLLVTDAETARGHLDLGAQLARALWDHDALAELVARGAAVPAAGSGVADALGRGDFLAAHEAARSRHRTAPTLTAARYLADRVEAAMGAGTRAEAVLLVGELARVADLVGGPWIRGVLARGAALTSAGDEAERSFGAAVTELAGADAVEDLARAHLLYGEWLRRHRRRREAHGHLVLAHDALRGLGHVLQHRAAAELAVLEASATSGYSRELTRRERTVAQLAAAGRTNLDIGRRLAISHHTVDHHLRRIYRKLGITGRHELRPWLAESP